MFSTHNVACLYESLGISSSRRTPVCVRHTLDLLYLVSVLLAAYTIHAPGPLQVVAGQCQHSLSGLLFLSDFEIITFLQNSSKGCFQSRDLWFLRGLCSGTGGIREWGFRQWREWDDPMV